VFSGGSAYGEEAIAAVAMGLEGDGARSGAGNDILGIARAGVYRLLGGAGPQRDSRHEAAVEDIRQQQTDSFGRIAVALNAHGAATWEREIMLERQARASPRRKLRGYTRVARRPSQSRRTRSGRCAWRVRNRRTFPAALAWRGAACYRMLEVR
jgi:hypothetical protein